MWIVAMVRAQGVSLNFHPHEPDTTMTYFMRPSWTINGQQSDHLATPPVVDRLLNVACLVSGASVVPALLASKKAGFVALSTAASVLALRAYRTWRSRVRVETLASELAGIPVSSNPLPDTVSGPVVTLSRAESRVMQELVAATKLDAPLLSDTPANRAAVMKTMLRTLRELYPDRRFVDCKRIITIALEYMFIPDESDVLAANIRRSTFAATMRQLAPLPTIK